MNNEKEMKAVEQAGEDKPADAGGKEVPGSVIGAILGLAGLAGLVVMIGYGLVSYYLGHRVSVGEETAIVGILPVQVDALAGGKCWVYEGGQLTVLKVEGDYVLVKYQTPSVQVRDDGIWSPCPNGTLAVLDKSFFTYLRHQAAAEPAKRRAAEEKTRAEQKFLDEMNSK